MICKFYKSSIKIFLHVTSNIKSISYIFYLIIQKTRMADDGANVYMVEQVEISSESEGSELLEDVNDLDDIADSINDINEL